MPSNQSNPILPLSLPLHQLQETNTQISPFFCLHSKHNRRPGTDPHRFRISMRVLHFRGVNRFDSPTRAGGHIGRWWSLVVGRNQKVGPILGPTTIASFLIPHKSLNLSQLYRLDTHLPLRSNIAIISFCFNLHPHPIL